MNAFLYLINTIIELYIWAVIIAVIFGWLLAFNLLNVNSSVVQSLNRGLKQLTEPVFGLVRRVVPTFGAIDLSPLIVIILLVFAQRLLVEFFYG